MLLKSCIYIIAIVLGIFSLVTLIYSIINKNRNISKHIIIICITYTIYLFLDLMIIPSILRIEIGLEMLFFYQIALLAGILYIISLLLCIIKIKRNVNKYDSQKK